MSLWLNALGASVRFHDVNGVRTRCLEAGEGQPVLLLHGIGGHVEAFAKNVVPLAQRYRVIAVDMLGHGMTDKPDGDYMPPDYAAHILALMDTLGIARAHIVGESLGSWVAYWMIQAAPERVLSWTCCVGAGLQVDGFDNLRSPGVAELRRRSSQASAVPTRDSIRARLEWLFHEPERFVSDELVETRLRFWSNPAMLRIQPMIAGIMDPERGGSSTSPPNGSSASPRRRTSSGPNSIPPRPGRRPRRPAGMSGDRAWTSCRTADTGRSTRIPTASTSVCSASWTRSPPAPIPRQLLERKADHAIAKPGLCRVETTRLDEWRAFGPRIMGLEVADATASSLAFRMDDRKQRILVDQGSADGAVFYGWEVADGDALERLAARLDRAGVRVEAMSRAAADRRQVGRGLCFLDPSGNRHEAFCDPALADRAFRPGRAMSGFRTGPLGMGHVVLMAQRIEDLLPSMSTCSNSA